jgi:hypothetical protein
MAGAGTSDENGLSYPVPSISEDRVSFPRRFKAITNWAKPDQTALDGVGQARQIRLYVDRARRQ